MKIYYIGILRNDPKPATELAVERDLSAFSRFTRDNYGQFMSLFSCTVAERTKPGERSDIEEKSYTFHAYASSQKICGIIISDAEYPKLVAHQLLSKILDEFMSMHPVSSYNSSSVTSLPFPALKEYIVKYQDPSQADSIMRVQRELDETKIVLHQTIQSVLERGEKLDTIVEKATNVNAQSKAFYRQAKQQNSCCILM